MAANFAKLPELLRRPVRGVDDQTTRQPAAGSFRRGEHPVGPRSDQPDAG